MLKIYNTLHRQKQPFEPIEAGKVRMYVCGITVYDYCHIGHARVIVVFDMVYRYLRHLGYEVQYVRNITDIDDKIIARARENGESIQQLTERFIGYMHEDFGALGTLPPDIEPRATDNMDAIEAMIQTLVDKGVAYAADNGDVYYAVGQFPGYGKLSGKNPEQLRAGERVEIDTFKRDPLDFVLWKAAKAEEPGWDSAFGAGRPGWHIECSAMSTRCLGNHFDIHGGGQDLQFPHHENEIAQSEACTGETFVNYWMHNGFVRVNEEKMSKSLGNFFTIRDVLKDYRAEEIRFFILSSHYRSQLNYSEEQLDQARSGLERLYTALLDVDATEFDWQDEALASYQQRFDAAMNDDFNSADAIAVLFDLARELNRAKSQAEAGASALAGALLQLSAILGICQQDAAGYLRSSVGSESESSLSDSDIDQLIEQRLLARQNKNWAEADRIRDQLQDNGIVLEDGAGNTRWRRS